MPPGDNNIEAISIGNLNLSSAPGSFKVYSPLGIFIGEFHANTLGELRSSMAKAGIGRGVYITKDQQNKMQQVQLR